MKLPGQHISRPSSRLCQGQRPPTLCVRRWQVCDERGRHRRQPPTWHLETLHSSLGLLDPATAFHNKAMGTNSEGECLLCAPSSQVRHPRFEAQVCIEYGHFPFCAYKFKIYSMMCWYKRNIALQFISLLLTDSFISPGTQCLQLFVYSGYEVSDGGIACKDVWSFCRLCACSSGTFPYCTEAFQSVHPFYCCSVHSSQEM